MQYYLAGAMRRQTWYGFYTFEAVEQALREWLKGDEQLRILNPHRMDLEKGFNVLELPADYDWSQYPPGFDVKDCCERCYHAATESDYIVMLPGWEHSKNARIEKGLAEWVGAGVLYAHRRASGGWLFLSKSNGGGVLVETQQHTESKFPSPEDPGCKPTNPKDAVGSMKAKFSTIPAGVMFEIGLALLEGMVKYGRHNYRGVGVRASIYYDAAMGHLADWWEGQDLDPDSGFNHVVKSIASLVVLRDAMLQDKLEDDRPPRSKVFKADFNPEARRIIEQHKDKNPKHWTIKD